MQGALSASEVERIRSMRRSGASLGEIASEVAVTTRTVVRYLRPDRYRCSHCGATFPTSALAFEHSFDELD